MSDAHLGVPFMRLTQTHRHLRIITKIRKRKDTIPFLKEQYDNILDKENILCITYIYTFKHIQYELYITLISF